LQQNRINFHPLLFSANQTAFIEDVIPHEVSHLLTWQLFGKVKPHGQEWQAIMLDVFKRPPHTTHNFAIHDVAGEQFKYVCGCRSHMLTIRRHNKVLRGTEYQCRKCSHPLTLA